jgi:phage baseplate assembly protein W
MSEIVGTGLAFPLGVDAHGRLALADGVLDIEQSMRLIMDTAPGERPMRPDFGCAIHECVFEQVDAPTVGRVEDAIRAALDRWEPRIVVELIELDTSNSEVLVIDVRYRIKTTNDVRNLVYPFYVIPEDEE